MGKNAVAAGLADEALQHGCGDVEIGNDAILQRTHGHDGPGCAADDGLCLMPDAAHPQFVAARVDGDDAWLPHDDAPALHVDQCVGGAQINADILGKHSVYSPEKACKNVAELTHTVSPIPGLCGFTEIRAAVVPCGGPAAP